MLSVSHRLRVVSLALHLLEISHARDLFRLPHNQHRQNYLQSMTANKDILLFASNVIDHTTIVVGLKSLFFSKFLYFLMSNMTKFNERKFVCQFWILLLLPNPVRTKVSTVKREDTATLSAVNGISPL